MLNGPNGPVGNFSLIEVAELQFGYIMQLVDQLRRRQLPRDQRQRRARRRVRRAERIEAAKKTIWVTGCRSWYLDDRGIPAVWPWTFQRFREDMATPKLRGLRAGIGDGTNFSTCRCVHADVQAQQVD